MTCFKIAWNIYKFRKGTFAANWRDKMIVCWRIKEEGRENSSDNMYFQSAISHGPISLLSVIDKVLENMI